MIAALPMYDRPETAAANDRLWQGMRAGLGRGPETLTRDGDLWNIWQSPDLLIAQTCGYPFRARLHPHVQLVGTPVLALPDCPPGHYCSAIVIRADDPRDTPEAFAAAPFAYNATLSQSGWAAPQTWAAARGFTFSNPVKTGAHRASAMAVSEGRADIAAIDALTWEILRKYDRFTDDLRVLARTDPTPALPYITAQANDPAPLFDALQTAIAGLSQPDRTTLGITGLTRLPASDYLAVPNPPPPPPN